MKNPNLRTNLIVVLVLLGAALEGVIIFWDDSSWGLFSAILIVIFIAIIVGLVAWGQAARLSAEKAGKASSENSGEPQDLSQAIMGMIKKLPERDRVLLWTSAVGVLFPILIVLIYFNSRWTFQYVVVVLAIGLGVGLALWTTREK